MSRPFGIRYWGERARTRAERTRERDSHASSKFVFPQFFFSLNFFFSSESRESILSYASVLLLEQAVLVQPKKLAPNIEFISQSFVVYVRLSPRKLALIESDHLNI